MRKLTLLLALLLLCVTPARAADPAPSVVWLGGNAAGEWAFVTVAGDVLEVQTRDAPHNLISVMFLAGEPSEVSVSACGRWVYVVAVIAGQAHPYRFDIAPVKLPCELPITIAMPLVMR